MLGALWARVPGATREDIEKSLYKKKELISINGPRGAAHVVPTRDLALFTLGVLPQSDKEMATFLGPAATLLKQGYLKLTDSVEKVEQAMLDALDGKILTLNEIHAELRRALPKAYTPYCKGCKGPHVHMIHLAAAGLWGAICFPEDRGVETTFARTDQWLKREPGLVPPARAATALARRFVETLGPTNESWFAAWAGISSEQAKRAWAGIADELAEVDLQGARAYVLEKDVKSLKSAKPPRGIALLSPHDPYLNSRDRETLVPDPKLRAEVWRVVGNPGVLLVDGEIHGTWRPKKQGKKLAMAFQLFGQVSPTERKAIERKAEELGRVRGAETTSVALSS